jgi:hypothetical protein
MQLHFTAQEFNLLADILLNHDSSGVLLDQVLARHLRLSYEELDELKCVLAAHTRELEGQAACQDDNLKKTLEERRHQLDTMLDKVNEACAML